jgi:pimeloyl-ACP methyl ester carboxylesterase
MAARRLLPVLGACAALAGCGRGGDGAAATTTTAAAPAPAPAPRLTATACGDLPGFRCARLAVPLHRRGPRAQDGRRLTLDVAIQRGDRGPRGDLVLLSGGPGQPARAFGPRMLRRLGDALRGYRLVLLDQRGTGADALRCDALQRAVGSSDLTVPPRAAVLACAQTLGDDRDAYATADTVEDLDALRAALGDERWVLAGVSYGTFVALRYALAHARATRGLVLDSVVPQQGVELLERVPLRATARVLRAVCRGEAAPCAGDPADDLATLLRRRPALGAEVFDALTALSIGVPQLARIPALLHRARHGDLAPLRAQLTAVRRAEAAPAQLLSQGLHAATLCADGIAPWPRRAARAARLAALARVRRSLTARDTGPYGAATATGHGLVRTCLDWPAEPAPPPLPRDLPAVPALLLSGGRDLSAPLEWAREERARAPRGRLVVVPRSGHSVLAHSETARRAVRRFLQAQF